MAGQSKQTLYGTSSLESNDAHHAGASSATRRRRLVLAALGALGCTALLALSLGGHLEEKAATAASLKQEADAVDCWQSSYIDGETKMMEKIAGLKWKKTKSKDSYIRVNAAKQFQEMLGIGGAFTEASALQFAKLSPDKQEEILKLYWDQDEGSGYSFGRIPMGSCDFSESSYNYANVVNDTTMTYFDSGVEHDSKLLIPFIQRALEKNPDMKLFLAPWSPPAWMKQASESYIPSMLGSATPIGLNPEFQEAWALYFSKFISAYKEQGINFWGLTPQNEPEFAAPWEACAYNSSFQADFVGDFLGPIMKRDHPEVKIMVFDHNRASVWQWADEIFNHPTASDYVDGIAFHWYDEERYMDGVEFHERLNDTHFVDTSRFILATESCNCPGVAHGKEAWFRAQRYAHDMITDFNNWVVGWVDWNLILDHTGGPNHLGNNCDAPIIIDETEKDYYLQPMYYFIQHFSKYVPPGSRRIEVDVSATFAKPGDAQLFPRYPAELHTCDNSSRQAIHVTDDHKLQITGTPHCIDLISPQWEGRQVELVECQYTAQSWTFVDKQIRMDNMCLSLNHGSTQDGVRVTAVDCVNDESHDEHQRWSFKDGTMLSHASDKCVTAGYSFVQAAAFTTPANKTVVVVLNENTEDATFELQDGEYSIETVIPQGAIRTFSW